MDKETREETSRAIVHYLLPDASESRRKNLEQVVSSMTDSQLKEAEDAMGIGAREWKTSVVRDLIESRDLTAISYISRFGQIVDLSALEEQLNQRFSSGDSMYDTYSPTFVAHVEAFATYHNQCGNCKPYDWDTDYELLEGTEVPQRGHYVDYLQDYELMEAVEEHPERVTELVRIAKQRRGLSPEIIKEYFEGDSHALGDGIL